MQSAPLYWPKSATEKVERNDQKSQTVVEFMLGTNYPTPNLY